MQTESVASNRRLVQTLFDDRINPGRLDALGDLVADDYVGPNGERGPDGFAATVRSLRTAFPDIHFTLEDVVADDDRVVTRWTWHGTHDGPFREFAPSHRPVTNAGVGIYHIDAGKITRAWVLTDRLGFQQQIGALPTNPTPAPAPRTAPQPASR